MRLLSFLIVVIILAGCGPETPRKREVNGNPRSSSTSTGQQARGPKYDWTGMLSKVRNIEARKNKILELMREAVKSYDAYKQSGKTDKASLATAKKLKIDAGDLYDEMYDDVTSAAPNERVGEKLWSMRLRTFQSSYDRLSKKVRRIEFQ